MFLIKRLFNSKGKIPKFISIDLKRFIILLLIFLKLKLIK